MQNCGQPYTNPAGSGGNKVRGRIAIPLNEPLDPCRQYSFLSWASKMGGLENEDDPKVAVYLAHSIKDDLSPQGSKQKIDTWTVFDEVNWSPMGKVFTPDEDFTWLVFEMDNSAFGSHKTAGVYLDDVSLIDLCKQQFYCDNKTVDNLDNVYLSHSHVHGGVVNQYVTLSNLEYVTSLQVSVSSAISGLVYFDTFNEPAFNWKWDGRTNLGGSVSGSYVATGQYILTATLTNQCCSKTVSYPITVSYPQTIPITYNQENFARAPLPCCRPIIILDNTNLSGNQVFQASEGIFVTQNVTVEPDAEISIIAGEYVAVYHGVDFPPNTTIQIQQCPRIAGIEGSCSNEHVNFQTLQPEKPVQQNLVTAVVFPNAVSVGDKVTVQLMQTIPNTLNSSSYSLRIYTVSGQLIYSYNNGGFAGSSPIEIYTGNWASGLYIVHVMSEEGITVAQEKLFVGN